MTVATAEVQKTEVACTDPCQPETKPRQKKAPDSLPYLRYILLVFLGKLSRYIVRHVKDVLRRKEKTWSILLKHRKERLGRKCSGQWFPNPADPQNHLKGPRH